MVLPQKDRDLIFGGKELTDNDNKTLVDLGIKKHNITTHLQKT